MKRKWKWIVAIIIILCIGYGSYHYFFKKADAPKFRTAKVERGEVVETVQATGTIQATIQVDVGSQVSGTLQKINVDYNSQVKKGQIIAQIDPRTFQAQVIQNKANLQSAEAAEKSAIASVQNAKSDIANNQASLLSAKANAQKAKSTLMNDSTNYERSKLLRAQDLISQSDLDNAKTTYETSKASYDAAMAQITSSEAQLESAKANERVAETKIESAKADISRAKASLEQAQLNLNYTTIIAPVSGTVISKDVEEGQTVAASFSAPKLFSIAEDLTKMQAVASIDEADVGKVKENQKAIFIVDAYPDKKFEGTVSQIRSQPINVQNVVTYQGVIDVPNPNYELRPGMTATISFVVAEQNNSLKVPNSALRFKLEGATDTTTTMRQFSGNGQNRQGGRGGGQFRQGGGGGGFGGGGQSRGNRGGRSRFGKIYILDAKETPQPIDVRIGISDGSFTSIETDKLKEGQEVIIGYQTPEAPTARSPLSGRR